MKKIGIQFHATHEEIAEILKALCAEKAIYACLVSNNPFSVRALNAENPRFLDIEGVNFNGVNFIYFGEKPFFVDCGSIAEFRNRNEHHTSVLVGRQNSEVLQDSWFSCVASNDNEFEFGNGIAKFIKKFTTAGLIPVGPNGVRGKISKTLRYTRGAQDAYSEGVELKSMAGAAHFEVPTA